MGNMCAEMKEKMTFCAGSVVENPHKDLHIPEFPLTHTHAHIATGVSSRVNILIIINTCKGGNSFLRELSALFRIRMPRLTH